MFNTQPPRLGHFSRMPRLTHDDFEERFRRHRGVMSLWFGLVLFLAVAAVIAAIATYVHDEATCVEWRDGPLRMQCVTTGSFTNCEQVPSRVCVRRRDAEE